MIDQLDNLINHLLTYRESKGKQALTFRGATISFATPDEDFNLKPAINFFLYDIRENLSFRTSGQYSMPSRADREAASKKGQTISLKPLPLHVDFSYLITVWGNDNATKAKEEHQLLGNVMLELARYPSFPEEVLQQHPLFATAEPVPKITMLDAPRLQNIGEFWSAMKGKPKPMLHYTVTLPIYLLDKDLQVEVDLIPEEMDIVVSLKK